MKRAWLAAILVLAKGVFGAEGTLLLEVELTQLYMWRGLDLLDGTGALQPALTWNSRHGWYAGVWGSLSLDRSSGCREIGGDTCWRWDEIDVYAGASGELPVQGRLATGWGVSFTYFNFPHQPRDADTMELALEFSHPRLFGEAPLLPRWGVYYNRGAKDPEDDGFWVIAGADGSFSLGERPIAVSADVTWKDGDAGLWSYTGFSHANLGLATDFTWYGWTFRPALNLQKSFVNDREGIRPRDQVWVNLVLSRDF